MSLRNLPHYQNAITQNMRKYFPLYIYLVAYIFSCMIGSLMVLFNATTLQEIYSVHTGILVPTLNHIERNYYILLLLASPILLIGGYVFGIKYVCIKHPTVEPNVVNKRSSNIYFWTSLVIYSGVTSYVLLKLYNADAFTYMWTWLSYSLWVVARWMMFHSLGFFDYVFIYTLIPFTAAWLFISNNREKNKYYSVIKFLPIIIALFISAMIFQKKSMIVTELIISFSYLNYLLFSQGLNKKFIIVSILAAALAFLTLFVSMSVLRMKPISAKYNLQQLMQNSNLNANFFLAMKKKEAAQKLLNQYIQTALKNHLISSGFNINANNSLDVFLIDLLGRTSVTSLYYPLVYPNIHPYYGLDLGQDIFGDKKMPDDFVTVWNYIYNNKLPGAITAPYQFVLYSQVGIAGALLLSLFVGFIMAALYKLLVLEEKEIVWKSLFSTIVIMFLLNLAIDSGRNSLLASYGYLFPMLFLLFLKFLIPVVMSLFPKKQLQRMTSKNPCYQINKN